MKIKPIVIGTEPPSKTIVTGWSFKPVRDRINILIFDRILSKLDVYGPENEIMDTRLAEELPGLSCWLHFTNPRTMKDFAKETMAFAEEWQRVENEKLTMSNMLEEE